MSNSNGLVTGVVMVLIFVAGFGLGRYTVDTDGTFVSDTSSDTSSDQSDEDGAEASGSTAVAEEGTTIDSSMLTEGQRKLLNTLGVDADSITITSEMVACAEAKVGAARMVEIQNGATPSFTEGAKLVACYSGG